MEVSRGLSFRGSIGEGVKFEVIRMAGKKAGVIEEKEREKIHHE